MDKPMSSIGFKLMSLMFKVRDIFRPRLDLLKEAGIESGFCILDYGCGPAPPTTQIVMRLGQEGYTRPPSIKYPHLMLPLPTLLFPQSQGQQVFSPVLNFWLYGVCSPEQAAMFQLLIFLFCA